MKHNNVQHDVLFFITDVDDDKVILEPKLMLCPNMFSTRSAMELRAKSC